MQICDFVLCIVELLMCVGLFFLAKVAEKVKNTKWKLLYVLPFIFVLIMLAIFEFEISMLPAYLASVTCIVGYYVERPSIRKCISLVAAVLVFLCAVTVDNNPGYREVDYVGEFEEAFDVMKKHYVLAEHKDIDWDALYTTYHAKFEEVKKQHDPILNVITWNQFCNEFHDGHVSYATDEKVMRQAAEKMIGNDYGLSLVTLSDGDTVAVNVEEDSEAYQAGIRNGTVIRKWDGRFLEEVFDEVDMSVMMSMPLKENEDYYRCILCAGVGGEENEITFIDENGKEKNVKVGKIGGYYDRFIETIEILDQGVVASNLTFTEVTEDTYVLRIKDMQYDTESYQNGNHTQMQEELRNQLNDLKQKNVQHLIIDIRCNTGGSPQMIMAIAELFAPVGEHSYACVGVFDKERASYERDHAGKYKVGDSLRFVGENVWEDRKVTILVNARSISAADHFAYLMKNLELENIKIMGFQTTNASAQAISAVQMTDAMLTYSSIPSLTEDGEILIDTDGNRKGGIELDEKVDLNQEAIKVLFDEGEDYLLIKALEQ